MSQLFQFKSATATSIEYSGSDYLYIINNIAWTSIDIDTIEFGQLLDIVGKVNNGALYALRRTRLFDALDVKLGTDVSGNYAPIIQGIVNEWNGTEYEENSDAPIKRIKVFDSKETDIVQYDEIEKELTIDLAEVSGSIDFISDTETGKMNTLEIVNDESSVFTYDSLSKIVTFDVSGINSKNGFVCIRNIQATNPSENIGITQYSSNNLVVEKAAGNATDVTVTVLAITGRDSLKPEWVRVNGQNVTLTQHTTENLWTGTVTISLMGLVTGEDDFPHYVVTAEHSEGSIDTAKVYTEPAPVVATATFVGNYPLSPAQTSYSAGRSISVTVTSEDPFVQVEVVNDAENACSYYLSPTFASTTEKTINVTTASGVGSRDVKVRIKNPTGTWSDVFDSSSQGTTDHLHQIVLDNVLPTFSITSIEYPESQQALKLTEQAEVLYSQTGTQEIQVAGIGTDLTITTPSPAVGAQILLNRNTAGSTYNISTNNFTITAKRLTNDTSVSVSGIVQIAAVAPTITLTGTHTMSRLRSGGAVGTGTSVQTYPITIISDQRLQAVPVLTPGVGGGSLTGTSWTATNVGNGTNYTGRSLSVSDSLTRNTYTFTISSVTNLAGLTTSEISDETETYVIGGFVARNLKFDSQTAFDDIGVRVSGFNNATKLVVTINAVPGTYVEDTDDVYYTSGNHIYTIVDTSDPDTHLATGNAIRLNEPNVVGSNTTITGLPYTIEELA